MGVSSGEGMLVKQSTRLQRFCCLIGDHYCSRQYEVKEVDDGSHAQAMRAGTGSPMKFQIKEGGFGQGVKRRKDGQMGPRASSTLISGICPGQKYNHHVN